MRDVRGRFKTRELIPLKLKRGEKEMVKKKKVETGFNFKLFDRVVARFRKYPGNFAMNVGVKNVVKGSKFTEPLTLHRNLTFQTHCGTVGCFAGWTHILGDKTKSPIKRRALSSPVWGAIRRSAIDKLRIPNLEDYTGNVYYYESGSQLFHVEDWPQPFRAQYESARTNREKLKAALARFAQFRKEMGEFEKNQASKAPALNEETVEYGTAAYDGC